MRLVDESIDVDGAVDVVVTRWVAWIRIFTNCNSSVDTQVQGEDPFCAHADGEIRDELREADESPG